VNDGRSQRRTMKPHVKICGIARLEDAEAAVRLGAEYLGLNFYARSPRCIDVADAARLRRRIGDRATVVGVFVNQSRADVERIESTVGLDLLQFHGDEGPRDLEPFGARAIKVFRVTGALPDRELEGYRAVWGFLFDSARGSGYGGSGAPWDWDAASGLPADRPVFVAGGIRPDNVRDLLGGLAPWGIDVGSGVESAPGRKDPVLMERLFEEIAHAQDLRAT
jgi:phosphoribosylanthranilate isomerase